MAIHRRRTRARHRAVRIVDTVCRISRRAPAVAAMTFGPPSRRAGRHATDMIGRLLLACVGAAFALGGYRRLHNWGTTARNAGR